ncbi:MAG: sulfotransferase [Rhodospirillales bacterium]
MSPDGHENILFHIGYHKTASTFLQDKLFMSEPHGFIRFSGRYRLINENFIAANSFHQVSDGFIAQINSEALAAAARDKTLVVSHERLSGYPASGGFDSRLIADRIRSNFPGARVLIVIREQKSFIRSMYSQYITDGGDLCFRRFLNPPEPHICRVPGWSFDYARYDRLIAHYIGLFGKDRVCVLPFEMFRRDHQAFIDRIVSFCDRSPANMPALPADPVNVRRPLVMQTAARLINRFVFRTQLSPHGLVKARRGKSPVEVLRPLFNLFGRSFIERRMDARLRSQVNEAVGQRYAESNRITRDLIGTDLAGYGYPCGN